MHYANGREAKNGDKVVMITPVYDQNGVKVGGVPVSGILYDAVPGQDYCNGRLALTSPTDPMPNLAECLHIDDVNALVGDKSKVPDSSKG